MRYIMQGQGAVEPEIDSESSSPQNPTEPTEIKKVIFSGLVKRTASAGEQQPVAAVHMPANLEKSSIASHRVASPPPRIASPIFSPRLALKRTHSAGEQRPAAAEHMPASSEKFSIASQRRASLPPRIASPISSPRLALTRTASAGEQRPAAAEHVPASSEKSSIASPSPRLPVSPITSPRLTVDKSYADPRIQITIRNLRASQSVPQRSPNDMTQAIAGGETNVGRPIAAFKSIRSIGGSKSLPVRKFLKKSVFDIG